MSSKNLAAKISDGENTKRRLQFERELYERKLAVVAEKLKIHARCHGEETEALPDKA